MATASPIDSSPETRFGGLESCALPRLTVELVPATTICSNLRSILPPEDWDGIRRQAYQNAGYRCEICAGKGSSHPVEAHEQWTYVELPMPAGHTESWQVLTSIWALCPACHEVKHLGFAEQKGRLPQAMAWLAAINGWSFATTVAYAQEAFSTWRQRSRRPWGLDIGWLETIGWHPPVLRWPPSIRETFDVSSVRP
ncbi:hypothetical protein [Thiomonas sp.]